MTTVFVSALISLIVTLAVLYIIYLVVVWVLGFIFAVPPGGVLAPPVMRIVYVIFAVIAIIAVLHFVEVALPIGQIR